MSVQLASQQDAYDEGGKGTVTTTTYESISFIKMVTNGTLTDFGCVELDDYDSSQLVPLDELEATSYTMVLQVIEDINIYWCDTITNSLYASSTNFFVELRFDSLHTSTYFTLETAGVEYLYDKGYSTGTFTYSYDLGYLEDSTVYETVDEGISVTLSGSITLSGTAGQFNFASNPVICSSSDVTPNGNMAEYNSRILSTYTIRMTYAIVNNSGNDAYLSCFAGRVRSVVESGSSYKVNTFTETYVNNGNQAIFITYTNVPLGFACSILYNYLASISYE